MRCSTLHRRTLAMIAGITLLATATAAAPRKPSSQQTYGVTGATLPQPGIMAAGQPTGEQVQLLAEEGYRGVIDLRLPGEARDFDEPEAARLSGLVYINIPVTPETLDQAAIDRFVNAMRTLERPLIVHGSTADRPAALLYAWLVLEKKERPERALEQARSAGLRDPALARKVRKLVAERDQPDATAKP